MAALPQSMLWASRVSVPIIDKRAMLSDAQAELAKLDAKIAKNIRRRNMVALEKTVVIRNRLVNQIVNLKRGM